LLALETAPIPFLLRQSEVFGTKGGGIFTTPEMNTENETDRS
jgi:hypothetical protein